MDLRHSWVCFWSCLYILSTAITILRLYLRWKMKRLAKSDALTFFCLICSTNMFAIAVYAGWVGFNPKGIRPDQYATLALQIFFYFMSAMMVVPLSKVCVTLLLLEVEVNEAWRRFLKVIQALILLTALVNVTLCFFGCYTPGTTTFWSILSQNGVVVNPDSLHQSKCVVRDKLVPINGGFNVIYEFCIFIAAISLVFRVKTTAMQKAGLAFSFALGFFTIAASIMNLYTALTVYLRQLHGLSIDAIYLYRGGLWIAIEAYTGLCVASVLPIRSTLVHFFDRLITPFRKPEVFSEDSYATSGASYSKDLDSNKGYVVEIETHAERHKTVSHALNEK